MSNEKIYNQWTEFILKSKYKDYFQSNEEAWDDTFNQVKDYIYKNNKRPNRYDKDIQIRQIGIWITRQQINYKKKQKIMKNNKIYNQWTEFVNSNKYKKYFVSNNEV